jgi:hypothetical protein
MAYTLQALIGDEGAIRAAVPIDLNVVSLPQNKAMIPLTEALQQSRKIPFLPLTDEGLNSLPEAIENLAAPFVQQGKIVYVEAEFFGGEGIQACVLWNRGGQASPPVVDGFAINTALRFLGVVPDGHRDEFEALGLGLHRATEDWQKITE